MKKLSVLALSFFSVLSFAQAVSQGTVKTIVTRLASDEMKGRLIGTPENEQAANYISKLFKENKLDYCFGDSYLVPFQYKGQTVYNVCGIKKGTSEKMLGFSGHFDHIGTNDDKGDNIYNGADDDASGIAALVSISEYFKDKKPEFSMVFMAFNGEEAGLLGSTALAADKGMEKINKNLAALFNFEMIATESEFGKNAMFMTGDEFSDLADLFNHHADGMIKIYPDPYAKQQLFYRSDNVSYAKKKIIAHSFSTADMSKIKHYHQVNDDFSIVDVDNMTNIINNFAKTIEKLTPKTFAPKYNSKVKLN
ncbi:M28 family metallopeptidase [Chryseobacterium foetidum]|uniref:M28 family metallopeptidase n=1 Tax=Chryseobacterium foetidum TaxID=2951057 RepID=UPI0021C862C4|nr:M28 family peptidase [Chryseobacterium foetidum]